MHLSVLCPCDAAGTRRCDKRKMIGWMWWIGWVAHQHGEAIRGWDLLGRAYAFFDFDAFLFGHSFFI